MKKISVQISRTIIVLFLAGFILLLAVVDNLLRTNLQAELIGELQVECRLIDEILPESHDAIEKLLPRLSALTSARITVIDTSGRVLSDFDGRQFTRTQDNHLDRPEIQAARQSKQGFGSAIRHSTTIDDDLIYTAFQSPKQRFIRLAHHQSMIDAIIIKVRFLFFGAAFITVLLIFLITTRISRHITRPLTEIIDAASEIKSGNYSKEITVDEENEIGQLAKILNEMSAKLKADILQLNKLQEIRKDFVANASHELRTPVTSIRGYVESLLDGAMSDPEVSRRFLERTLSNIERLEIIIRDMLDLSQLEKRDKGLSLRYFDLRPVLENVMADFEKTARRKGLYLKLESGHPDAVKIIADAYQLEKALMNLIDNAIKYTEQGGVTVSTRVDEKHFVITVSDTGAGIKPDDLSRIFERFYRVDKGRSRDMGGSGLGLAIVKHIMEMHQGEVRVESEPGKGSRFILSFPR